MSKLNTETQLPQTIVSGSALQLSKIDVNDECALADLDQVVMEENKYEEYARELLGDEYQPGCFDKIIERFKTDNLITTEYANMRGYAFDIFLIFYSFISSNDEPYFASIVLEFKNFYQLFFVK